MIDAASDSFVAMPQKAKPPWPAVKQEASNKSLKINQ